MNTIISIDEAIKLQSAHYFTGKPCKRGHISKRYVKTRNCVDCLHPKYEIKDRIERRNVRELRSAAMGAMVVVRLRIYEPDLQMFKEFILNEAQRTCEHIRMQDIETRYKPLWAGDQAIHAFLCPRSIRDVLYFMQDDLEAQRKAGH